MFTSFSRLKLLELRFLYSVCKIQRPDCLCFIHKLNEYIDKLNENVYNIDCGGAMMTASEQIKVLCVRSGISLAELARRLNVSPQSLSGKIKRDSFTINDLENVADAVGVKFEHNFVLENGDRI